MVTKKGKALVRAKCSENGIWNNKEEAVIAQRLKKGKAKPFEKCTSRYGAYGSSYECQLEFGHPGDHRWGIAWSEKQAFEQRGG